MSGIPKLLLDPVKSDDGTLNSSPGSGTDALSLGFSKRAYWPLKVRSTSPTAPLRCLAMMITAFPRKSLPFSSLYR